MKGKLLLLSSVLLIAFGGAFAQNGTPHGVLVTWTAPSTAPTGYNVYRCSGACTVSGGTWTKINTAVDPSNSYLDGAAGLAASTTYSYAASSVDASGNESPFSNVAFISIPAAGFPQNPGTPSGCNAKVQ